jgi:dihydrofolate reductase
MVEKFTLGIPLRIKELTLVHHTFEADAFFPVIKEEEWVLQQSELQLRRQASI